MFSRKQGHVVISYKNLRRLIGILGIALPVICLAGFLFTGVTIQPSISHYYYTNVRDAFIGILIGVSMFLITYDGYTKTDDWITNFTGFFGFGIALFPCLYLVNPSMHVGFFNLSSNVSDYIHLTCAVLFFALLAYNSIFLFTKTGSGGKMTANKKKRNVLFVICGAVILAALLTLFVLRWTLGEVVYNSKPIVFTLESVMLIAFGVSWLVKGETMWRDKVTQSNPTIS
ncbi:MAG TPA: hypothetical protein VHO70_13575 [Chitinispirillaceae bacterium]|nr:hypothetical protein [Chitinispirillaceae bacterium]